MLVRDVKLSDIKIKPEFENSNPSKTKFEKLYDKVVSNQYISKGILVDDDLVLLDGYILYLVYKELGYETCKVFSEVSDVYVYGTHINDDSNKEYVWKLRPQDVSNADSIEIGQLVLCECRRRLMPITVTRVEKLPHSLNDSNVRYVVKIKDVW